MNKRVAAFVAVLSLITFGIEIPGVGAQETTFCLDPGFGSGGRLDIVWADADWYWQASTHDRQGRVLVTSYSEQPDHLLDRIQRFNLDGSLDASFANGGTLAVAGEVHSSRNRKLAVDRLGRIWLMRTSWDDVVEFRRYLADGSVDESFEVVEFQSDGLIGYLGDLQVVSSSVLAVWGVEKRDPDGSTVEWVQLDDGVIAAGTSPTSNSHWLRVRDVSPDGWVSGQAYSTADPEDGRGFAWLLGTGFEVDPYIDDEQSTFSGITYLHDGRIIASGSAGVIFQPTDAYVVQLREPTPTSPTIGRTGFGAAVTELGGSRDSVYAISGFGVVVLRTGGSDVRPGFGFLNPDGTIEIETLSSTTVGGGASYATVNFDDGSIAVSGYGNGGNIFSLRISPMHQPAEEGALGDQVRRLYLAYLQRLPEPRGLEFWRGQLVGGARLDSMSESFARSPEFLDLYGSLENEEFVDLIYQNVLGRSSDPAGAHVWTGRLDSGAMTRGEVMTGFSESYENIMITGTVAPHSSSAGSVLRLYQAYFERDPDSSDSCYWTRSLAGGMSLGEVSDFFASSEEFGLIYGSLNDREFVELVYSNVLGRTGEESGVVFWTGQLESAAMTRGQMMIGFSESAEFIGLTDTLPPGVTP